MSLLEMRFMLYGSTSCVRGDNRDRFEELVCSLVKYEVKYGQGHKEQYYIRHFSFKIILKQDILSVSSG